MRRLVGLVLGAISIVAVPAGAAAQPQTAALAPAAPARASAANPAPLDPAALAVAHQIIAIGMPVEKRSQMFTSLMNTLAEQTRKSTENLAFSKDKDFQALLDRSVQRMWDETRPIMTAALPDIYESMARAYARDFSIDDLNALLGFVKTPAGQHFFERSPLILKDPDVQAAQQRMVAQLMTKLPEITRENMQDVEDYVARKSKQAKPASTTPVS
jgi:hypothetical protein